MIDPGILAIFDRMINETEIDRVWFHNKARETTPWNTGLMVDAACCEVRKKAIKDAQEELKRYLTS